MTFRNAVHEGVTSIVVDNFGGGSITIEPGPQPGLVESSLNAPDDALLEQIEVRHDGEYLRIAFPPQVLTRHTRTHLRLAVPPGVSYLLKAAAADIAIRAEIGRSKIISGSGDVTADQAGDLDCSTGSGHVSVSRLVGTGARLSSGSGNITVGEAHCPLTAKSGSGDVVVKALRATPLQASSGSGDITVTSASGHVDLRSASGSLTVGVADHLPAWIDASSASGAIRIALDSAPQPPPGAPYISVRARTASGDITLYRA